MKSRHFEHLSEASVAANLKSKREIIASYNRKKGVYSFIVRPSLHILHSIDVLGPKRKSMGRSSGNGHPEAAGFPALPLNIDSARWDCISIASDCHCRFWVPQVSSAFPFAGPSRWCHTRSHRLYWLAPRWRFH